MHVLVVGSSVIDLFLTADRQFAKIAGQTVSFNLGDKVPTEIKQLAIGGNSANVSVGLTRLEIPTTFYTYLGGDILSREIEEGLSREGVELIIDKNRAGMSPLSIIFDFDNDRIIFSNHQKRDYNFELKEGVSFDFIYITSIGDSFEKAYEQVLEFSKTQNIPLAFSPGVRQIENKNDLVNDVLKNSKIYFSNREEAMKIINHKSSIINPKELLYAIKNLGPEIVSITNGANGAYALDERNNAYFIEPLPTAQDSERTGAGDAYSSGFFASFLYGGDVPTAMRWGTCNAYGVMKKVGAQNGLLTKAAIDSVLKANNNLKAESI